MKAPFIKSLLVTAIVGMGLNFTPMSALADVSISYPENEWRVDLVPGVKGIDKSYCAAHTVYDNRSILTFGLMPEGRMSMVVDLQQELFEKGSSYNVYITFPSGVNGSLAAFARDETSLIIQGSTDDVLWKQLEKHDLFSYDVADQTRLFSLEYFPFIRRNLDLCLERLNKVVTDPDSFEQTDYALDNHFDLGQVDLFKRVEKSKIVEVEERLDTSLFSKNYGVDDKDVLKPLLEPVEPIVLEETDVLDRLFLTLDDTEYAPEVWLSPDIPAMPDNYVSSEIDVANSLSPNVPKVAVEEVEMKPLIDSGILPDVLGFLAEKSGLVPIADTVKEAVDDGYVRYGWQALGKENVLFEQVSMNEMASFGDFIKDFAKRNEQICAEGFSSEVDDVIQADPFELASGKIYCLGGGVDDRYTALAFYAGYGAFSVVAVEGAFSQVADLTQKRDRILDVLMSVSENEEKM